MVDKEWKNILNYEGLYQVNNFGEIKSKKNNKEKILKGGITTKGYRQVELYKNGKAKRYYVHRIVAETFIPNSNNLPLVNHKNENKLDNSVANLEWCNNSYNLTYGNTQKNKKRKILQYDVNNKIIKKWDSIKEASIALKIAIPNICKVCNNERKTAGGYTWRYMNGD